MALPGVYWRETVAVAPSVSKAHGMNPAHVRAYVDRDWALVQRLKERYWAERQLTPEEALALGDDLRRHVLAVRPDWPTDEDRLEDLEVHARVSESLRRVASQRRR